MHKFKSPKCVASRCVRTEENLLCDNCVQYANQDFVSLRERALAGTTIDKFATASMSADLWPTRPEGVPSFERILRGHGLTKRQATVLNQYFDEGKSFSQIGDLLRISKACAHKHCQKALKKVSKGLTLSTWVKALHFKNTDTEKAF